MRHRIAGTKLKREPEHRNMLLRNLATSVLEHGRITTTLAKAKATQPVVEQLITLAKGGWDLNKFRRVLTVVTKKDVAWRLFKEYTDGDEKTHKPIAARFADRNGGYTRIYKLSKVRQGDCSQMAVISLLGESETVASAKPVAPVVSAE
ncbi:MAG: 50S ribosomal protein L17 [Planctomycetota bacterium]|jgi:large subunit ribosomal protein L17|nr:MAG: 50S ribosomal protein L17 [Planctomycetota bacterium]